MKGGLKCPTCGTATSGVIETRLRESHIYRRRRCYNGHTFTTKESVVGAKHRREAVRDEALKLLETSRHFPVGHPNYLTIDQIAKMVGMSRETVYRIKRGEVASRQLKKATLKRNSK